MKRIAVVLCTLIASSGCRLTLDPDPVKLDASTPMGIDAATPDSGAHPGTITVRGRVCTRPQIDHVKIQILIDASGSMCVTDGPGSQLGGGFCEVMSDYFRSKGVTVPGRVRALKTLMQHLALQDGVLVALVPFDVSTADAYPLEGFVPATDPALTARVDALQDALGKGTDYQGALAAARRRIEDDIARTVAAGKQAELAHTRYQTVFLSDGVPYPRCSSIDEGPTWATVENPAGRWQDNPSSFCNTPPEGADAGAPECLGTDCPGDAGVVYSDVIPDFAIGGDRNQNWNLLDEVDAMAGLQGVGEVRLDTVLLYNTDAIAVCGPVCATDLFSLPGVTPEDARRLARWTLKQLAIRGHGSFHEYNDSDLISFGWVDTSEVGRAHAARMPGPFAHRYEGEMTPEVSAGFPGPERPIAADSDGDGFPDAFEAARLAEGFDPAVPDARGCKSVPGAPAVSVCDDADGDGLSEPVELYLGTNPFSPDSDADGIPDGMEAEAGLDPARTNAGLDGDGDRVSDLDEVLQGSDPLKADAASAYAHPAPQVTAVPQADGTTCYDFVVEDVWLDPSGFSGRNYLLVPFAQVPQGAAGHAGTWRQACAFAIAPAPGTSTPDVVFADADFVPMSRFGADVGQVLPADFGTLCKEVRPR